MSPWKPKFWREFGCVLCQLSSDSLWDRSETVCASQSRENISVWRMMVMVHILQSTSSAPRVTVSPKSWDMGSFLFHGKQFGSSSFTEGATGGNKRVSAACLCQCSGVGAPCAGWGHLWLWKILLPPWPPAAGEGAGSSRSCRGEMSCVSLRGQEEAGHFPWHKPAMFWAGGLSIWHRYLQDTLGSHPPHSLSEILISKVFAVCDICSFSSFVGGGGDCVFPTQATFSCKCFQESCFLPGKGDLGTKIRLPCSRRTPPEVSAWREPVSWSLWEEGGAWRALAVPAQVNPAGRVCLTAGFHLGFPCPLEV